MKQAGYSILISGANRGIGRALVEEALKRGAGRVYAGSRTPFSHPDERVIPLKLDVTDPAQIQEAIRQVESLDILVNNAGVAFYDDLGDRSMIEKHLDVNFFGLYDLTQGFLPKLVESEGSIVNILSVLSLAPFPPIASYSISKAAAFSLTQSLRGYLAAKGVKVHAVLTGPVDTDMTRGLDVPKITPELAARGIFDGIDRGEEEIFPDPMSATLADSWRGSAAKELERRYAGAVSSVQRIPED